MDKKVLIRNIKGETTQKEFSEVAKWIEDSKENRAYYNELYNIIIAENVSRDSPENVDISDQESENIYKEICYKTSRKRFRFISVMKYAAVLVLLCSVMVNMYYFAGVDKEVEVTSKIAAVANIESVFYTEKGTKAQIMLPDSSLVWLNSDSKIIFHNNFESDKRRVKFEGEGYFEIVGHPEWPMEIVTTKGMVVSVLGTSLHIKSYSNDSSEEATLYRGKVVVSKNVKGSVKPTVIELEVANTARFDDVAEVNSVIKEDDIEDKTVWKEGILLFNDTKISEVVKILERWYGLSFMIEDKKVLENNFTATFTAESITQVMELLSYTAPISYEIKDNIVRISSR